MPGLIPQTKYNKSLYLWCDTYFRDFHGSRAFFGPSTCATDLTVWAMPARFNHESFIVLSEFRFVAMRISKSTDH